MNNFWIHIGNRFFLVCHTALILFNALGRIWKKTRWANLISLLFTAGAWLLLGSFFGIGYCLLTNWHFEIVRQLGQTDIPYSCIRYFTERLIGFSRNALVTDIVAVGVVVIAWVLSVYLYIRERHKTNDNYYNGQARIGFLLQNLRIGLEINKNV